LEAIFIKAVCFIAIIALGYILREVGFFPAASGAVLSKIVIGVTLPASIVCSYSGKIIDPALLTVSLLGLGANLIYMAVAALPRHHTRQTTAFDMVNLSGYNIGTFTLPFVQSFLGPVALMTTTLFDTGAALISLGGSYSAASVVQDGSRFSLKRVGRTLSHSVPFMTYVIMLILALAKVHLPGPVLEFSGIIAAANPFLAMLMIGTGMRLKLKKEHLRRLGSLLAVRYGVAVVFALLFWLCLPFSEEIRKVLVILVFSPTASASPAWTGELHGDVGLAGTLGSVSICISIAVIMALLMV